MKKKSYICNKCGEIFPKWHGQCDSCGSWNSITEHVAETTYQSKIDIKKQGNIIEFSKLSGDIEPQKRLDMQNNELNRVLGGGLVAGSAILLGGGPGIGKSTLLMQTIAKITNDACRAVYISGEESVDQIRLRAKRMGIDDKPVDLATTTSVGDIIKTINKLSKN